MTTLPTSEIPDTSKLDTVEKDGQRWVTTRIAADFLAVSLGTVFGYIRHRKHYLQTIEFGGHLLVSVDSLVEVALMRAKRNGKKEPNVTPT